MKKTKWFDARIFVPFHVGVYKVKPAYRGAKTYFSYWDGKKWGGISNYHDVAVEVKFMTIHLNIFGWQGLAVNP